MIKELLINALWLASISTTIYMMFAMDYMLH